MTEFVYIKGKASWFRHRTPETFNDKSFWKHTIHPDADSLEIIRDLQAQGLKNQLKKDDDGYYISFNRPTKIIARGTEKLLEPPVVILADGKSVYTGEVGNGSDITTKLEVYSHRVPGATHKAKAARWLSTRIDTLVPFVSNRADAFDPEGLGFDKDEQRAVRNLPEQPPQKPF